MSFNFVGKKWLNPVMMRRSCGNHEGNGLYVACGTRSIHNAVQAQSVE